MALELQQSGTFFQPGPIGRGLRLIAGLLILLAISPLIIRFRPGYTLSIDDWGPWVALAIAILAVNDVVNIGLGRDFGQWPRFGIIGLPLLGSLGDYLINVVWWGEIIALVIAAELLLVLGYLGVSFLVAAALAVPG